MNQGVVHSSQMVASGCPNWWNINNMTKPPDPHHQHVHHSLLPMAPHHQLTPPLITGNDSQDLPESWSQLLQGGFVGEEDHKTTSVIMSDMQAKKLENWEQQFLNHQISSSINMSCGADVIKQENSYDYGGTRNFEFHHQGEKSPVNSWNQMMMLSSASSPKSCVTTTSLSTTNNNMLDFSHKSSSGKLIRRPDPSSHECNSRATGGAAKKARIQPCSVQSTFKVRKEKLGDRITALHQLVSPFGKTDTASVLLEAIGYIRFLQSQIEALTVPYLGNGSTTNLTHQHPHVQGERNSLFPEDPGQLLNKKCIKRKAAAGLTIISDEGQNTDDHDQAVAALAKKDLKSRGLCLVPISCTLHVGTDSIGADYWAPPSFAGNF